MGSFTQKIKTDEVNNKDTLCEIGMLLREARENKLLSIKDVKEITCIPIHHIVAIEEGDVRNLPEDPFLMGFIRRYVRVVGLDEYYICNAYMNSRKRQQPKVKEKKADDFDLLFDNSSDEKILNFKTRDRMPENMTNVGKILKASHFYFTFIFFMLITACYLVVQITVNSPDSEKYKTAVNNIENLDKLGEESENTTISEDDKPIVVSENKSSINDVPDVRFADPSVNQPQKPISVAQQPKPILTKKVVVSRVAKVKAITKSNHVASSNIKKITVSKKAYVVRTISTTSQKQPDLKIDQAISEIMLRPLIVVSNLNVQETSKSTLRGLH